MSTSFSVPFHSLFVLSQGTSCTPFALVCVRLSLCCILFLDCGAGGALFFCKCFCIPHSAWFCISCIPWPLWSYSCTDVHPSRCRQGISQSCKTDPGSQVGNRGDLPRPAPLRKCTRRACGRPRSRGLWLVAAQLHQGVTCGGSRGACLFAQCGSIPVLAGPCRSDVQADAVVGQWAAREPAPPGLGRADGGGVAPLGGAWQTSSPERISGGASALGLPFRVVWGRNWHLASIPWAGHRTLHHSLRGGNLLGRTCPLGRGTGQVIQIFFSPGTRR